MSWSEERVEILKKLWLDGLSASQIAKQLGDVTRNAVIGKVHRLGLAGRASPSHPEKHPKSKADEAIVENAAPAEEAENVEAPEVAPSKEDIKEAVKETIEEIAKEASPKAFTREEKFEELDPLSKERSIAQSRERDLQRAKEGKLLTVLQLNAHVCKWPIGDPTDPDFGFCGAKTHGDWPYCKEHGEIAYQPQLSRRGGVAKQENKEVNLDEEAKK